MASSCLLAQVPLIAAETSTVKKSSAVSSAHFDGLRQCAGGKVGASRTVALSLKQVMRESVGLGKRARVVCAVGDVSSAGNTYLIAGAIAVALIGTAFPFVFSRKDTCPECGGAGFVRGQPSGGALRANAARKDQPQIVCKNCNGLGKIGQTDKL